MECKALKVLCITVWTLLVVLVTIMFLDFKKSTKPTTEEKAVIAESEKQIEVNGISNQVIQIIGDDNVINVATVTPVETAFDMYVARVNTAIKVWGASTDNNYAKELSQKIIEAADNNDLDREMGFAIAHIESDFRTNARNRKTNATGLCQLTPNCIDEYNWSHNTKYTMQDALDPDINLEIGFWYYKRILTHYAKSYGYITTTTPEKELRDAYLAYNVGVTLFSKIGKWGRNELRQGRYPCDMYGSKAGDPYSAIDRFYEKIGVWL